MGHFFSAGSGQNYRIKQVHVMKPTRHLPVPNIVSSSESDSETEEAEPDDGFGWVNMPQNDITGVECRKFIADELNVDPSSPFLLDILSEHTGAASGSCCYFFTCLLSSSVPEEGEWDTFPI